MEHPSHPVESHWRTSLRNRIIQASSLLEVLLSGLVLIGLLLSVVPLIRWMPGLLFDGNEAEIRTFLERSPAVYRVRRTKYVIKEVLYYGQERISGREQKTDGHDDQLHLYQ